MLCPLLLDLYVPHLTPLWLRQASWWFQLHRYLDAAPPFSEPHLPRNRFLGVHAIPPNAQGSANGNTRTLATGSTRPPWMKWSSPICSSCTRWSVGMPRGRHSCLWLTQGNPSQEPKWGSSGVVARWSSHSTSSFWLLIFFYRKKWIWINFMQEEGECWGWYLSWVNWMLRYSRSAYRVWHRHTSSYQDRLIVQNCPW